MWDLSGGMFSNPMFKVLTHHSEHFYVRTIKIGYGAEAGQRWKGVQLTEH